jgi:flagellar biosynthesis chaperone FliJ
VQRRTRKIKPAPLVDKSNQLFSPRISMSQTGGDANESLKRKANAKKHFTDTLQKCRGTWSKMKETLGAARKLEDADTEEMEIAKNILMEMYRVVFLGQGEESEKNPLVMRNNLENSINFLLHNRGICDFQELKATATHKILRDDLLNLDIVKYFMNINKARNNDAPIYLGAAPFCYTEQKTYPQLLYSVWAHEMQVQCANFFLDFAKAGYEGPTVDVKVVAKNALQTIDKIAVLRTEYELITENIEKDFQSEIEKMSKDAYDDAIVRFAVEGVDFI